MSEHVQRAIAELVQKRDRLSATIQHLEWFAQEFPHTAAAVTVSRPARDARNHRPKKAKAQKRDGTGRDGTGREQTSRQRAARSLPDNPELADRVVAALRHRHPQKPGELAKVTKLTGYAHRAALIKLAAAGVIKRSGTGRGALVSLPGKSPAKEGL